METISGIVKRLLDTKPFIHEAVLRGIVSYTHLAEVLIPDIQAEYSGQVRQSAVVMALRRHADALREEELSLKSDHIAYELTVKTNILDVNIVKRPAALHKMNGLYQAVALARGDFLNITIASNEIGIAVSDKYQSELEELLTGETILHRRSGLVAVSLIFSGDFLHTPGVIYKAVRRLAWEHINVLEIVSTIHELTFVINREDSSHALEALQNFL
jgi:hypothetical protein